MLHFTAVSEFALELIQLNVLLALLSQNRDREPVKGRETKKEGLIVSEMAGEGKKLFQSFREERLAVCVGILTLDSSLSRAS